MGETRGNFFEDFSLGQLLVHAPARTVNVGDQALYTALTGSRFALQASDTFARSLGLPQAPLDDFLVFHLVFGKTVPDVSRNVVLSLGYADGRFGVLVYPGDTLSAESEVIGLSESDDGKSGTVYVRSIGRNQHGQVVLDYKRWVLIQKRDVLAPAPPRHVPDLLQSVPPEAIVVPAGCSFANFDIAQSGSSSLWEDYVVGDRIDHVDGMTIEEAEHQLATRLYHNTARVHFDQLAADHGRLGRRLVYLGHVISLARALSFNGLGNAVRIAALNSAYLVNPIFAGHTTFTYSEVLDKWPLSGRDDAGALRLRMVVTKDLPCGDFPDMNEDGSPNPSVVLKLDYTVLMPRRT